MPRYPIIVPVLLLALLAVLISGRLWAQPIVNVEIEGINAQMETNVRLFLSIEQQRNHALMSVGRINRLHQKANQEIANALQPYGFYRPEIVAELTEVEAGEWRASYVIDPGPVFLPLELHRTLLVQRPVQSATM